MACEKQVAPRRPAIRDKFPSGAGLHVDRCGYCSSAFGDRRCYFCQTVCCTGCMTDDRSRCKRCYIKKARLGWRQVLGRNKAVLAFVAGLWLYAVFPGPLMPGLDPTFYAVSVAAAVLIMIPVCLAMFFWSLNPPSSDLRRGKD